MGRKSLWAKPGPPKIGDHPERWIWENPKNGDHPERWVWEPPGKVDHPERWILGAPERAQPRKRVLRLTPNLTEGYHVKRGFWVPR